MYQLFTWIPVDQRFLIIDSLSISILEICGAVLESGPQF